MTCKDCNGKEPDCIFSENEEGQKNEYCEKCVEKRIKNMVLAYK